MRQNRHGGRGHRRGSHRYHDGPPRPRPGGFTGLGVDELHQVLLPGFQGPEKRQYYNGIARGMVLVFGLVGFLLGTALAGPLGALFGLGLGAMFAGRAAMKGRYYRRGHR